MKEKTKQKALVMTAADEALEREAIQATKKVMAAALDVVEAGIMSTEEIASRFGIEEKYLRREQIERLIKP
jgi:hypothetical protein